MYKAPNGIRALIGVVYLATHRTSWLGNYTRVSELEDMASYREFALRPRDLKELGGIRHHMITQVLAGDNEGQATSAELSVVHYFFPLLCAE